MHLRDLKQETSSFVGILAFMCIEISCSVALSMKKSLITFRPDGRMFLPTKECSGSVVECLT